jgi:hypothetical protein
MGIYNEFNKASFAARVFDDGSPSVALDRGGGNVLTIGNNANQTFTNDLVIK